MNATRATTLRLLVLAAPLAVALAIAAPAAAYKMEYFTSPSMAGPVACDFKPSFAHWPSTTDTMVWYLNTSGQGSGKSGAVQAALASWTNASESDHQLLYGGTTTAELDLNDNQSTFVWDDTSALCGGGGCHAVTVLDINLSTQVISETDIVFNEQMTWRVDGISDPCPNTAPGTQLDTQAIATHELGHTLGLYHSTVSSTTMGDASCSLAGRSLHADDLAGLQCVTNRYPPSPAYSGALEIADCRNISGWAYNADRPNDPVYVEVRRGSTLEKVLIAETFRVDLPGDGNHAFSMTTPGGFKNGSWQSAGVRFSGGSNANLPASPVSIVCALDLFPRLWQPDTVLDTAGTVYTVGTDFSSTKAGRITHIGLHVPVGETGTHSATLWTDGGTELGTATLGTPSSIDRWAFGAIQDVIQGGPVAILANTRYRVSVNTNVKQSKSPCSPSSSTSLYQPWVNNPLTAHQGYWKAGTGFPNISSCSNFFVSVRFDM